MTTITFRVSEEERSFFEAMAKFNGMTLSELARKKLLASLEDEFDLKSYQDAMTLHQKKDESISHEEMRRALDL